MNIFFLDTNVKKCAEYHCDKHVVKMILESAQLLCGVHHAISSQLPIPYKLSHINHPCSIWVRESLSNYLLLCELATQLCEEYTYRYGKIHKSKQVIDWCLINKPVINDIGVTKQPQAMPEEYKVKNDVVQSYRNYYVGAKKSFAKWKNRETPYWYN